MEQDTKTQVDEERATTSDETEPTSSDLIVKLKGLLLSSYSKFVARKAVFYLVVVFFSVSLVFFIIEAMPGDPVEVMLASGNSPPGADLEALAEIMRQYFGLDRPFHERYFTYIGNIFGGNLGQSYHFYPVLATDIIQYYSMCYDLLDSTTRIFQN